MAVRLQLKLGAVTEQDQLADSPDAIVVVEPSVGSVARSKGNLYLLVTSRDHRQSGARSDADDRRHDPQRVLLRRVGRDPAVPDQGRWASPTSDLPTSATATGWATSATTAARSASRWPWSAAASCTWRRSARPRPTSSARPACRPCPIRTAIAACRSRTSSPRSGAASSRSATRCASCRRTSWPRSAPTPSRTRSSRSIPQSAIEHLHAPVRRRRRQGQRRRHRVRGQRGRRDPQGQDPGPGAPRRAAGRRPGQVADPARRHRHGERGRHRRRGDQGQECRRQRVRAGDLADPGHAPTAQVERPARRSPARRRAWRCSGGRRWPCSPSWRSPARSCSASTPSAGSASPWTPIPSLTAAKSAFEAAQEALDSVSGPGVDLIADDPRQALELLNAAYQQLDAAEEAGYPLEQIEPLRKTALAGLDRLYRMTNVKSSPLYHVPQGQARSQLAGLVRGFRRRAVRAGHRRQDRLAHRPRQEAGVPDPAFRAAGVGHAGAPTPSS